MITLNWIIGIPKEVGLYWFDNGVRFGSNVAKNRTPILFQVTETTSRVFSRYGSAPVSSIYNDKICLNPRFMPILKPQNWQFMRGLSPIFNKLWVRHNDGYVGVGLLQRNWSSHLHGHIAWLTHPHVSSQTDLIIKYGEGLMFSPIIPPDI